MPGVCEACQLGKSHKLPFSKSHHSSTAPLELLYSDVWGPSPILSSNGHRNYVHFLDDFTKFTWIFPMINKSDVLPIFKQFKMLVENLFGHNVIS